MTDQMASLLSKGERIDGLAFVEAKIDGSAARASPGKIKRLATTIVFSPHSWIVSFGYVGAQIRI